MRVCLTTEERFARTPDGRVWCLGGSASYSFLQRYLGIFDEIRVIARVADALEPAPSWKLADGPGVTFGRVPNYVGPLQYLRRIRSVHKAVRQALGSTDAVILRVGSQIATSAESALRGGRPFGLEVIGDPYNVFAPGASKHALRPFWRWWFTTQMRRQCAKASTVCYVTGKFLQQNYPPADAAFCTSFLNMELGEELSVPAPRRFHRLSGPVRIVTVGSMEQPYKGIDILIEAIAKLLSQGEQVHLTIVGEGRYRRDLERQAVLLGIDKHINFTGAVANGQPIRDQLDQSQIFVLASRTEGLPRAVIEAMARGLPCIGSAVGGIPELLPPEDLVPPGDATALSRKILEVLKNPARMERTSAMNLTRARDYSDPVSDAKRQEFLFHLHRVSQHWLTERAGVRTK